MSGGWTACDARSPRAQAALWELFRSHVRHAPLSHINHLPEEYAAFDRGCRLHHHRGKGIGFCEVALGSGRAFVPGLFADLRDPVHVGLLDAYLPGCSKSSLFLQLHAPESLHEAWDKIRPPSRLLSTLRLIRKTVRYAIDISRFSIETGLSARLRRSYRKTLPHIERSEFIPARGLDLRAYFVEVKKFLFFRGLQVPPLPLLESLIKRAEPEWSCWLGRVKGRCRGVETGCAILVSVSRLGGMGSAKFLYSSDRRAGAPAWLSPSAVCQVEIIHALRGMGISHYDLGMFGPTVSSLSQFKAQFLNGTVTEIHHLEGELAAGS